MSAMTSAFLTDTGLVRKMNQDSVVVVPGDQIAYGLDGLYVVADGMGGKAGGEIASRVTVETVPAVVHDMLNGRSGVPGPQAMADALREALEAANEAVYTQARANPELRGMGTTCVAALVREGRAIIGNVGDSRIYLLRAGRLVQLTSDHSLVQEHIRSGEMTKEEARGSRFKNVITRAIGIARSVDPDIDLVEMEEGDTLLLCSDGLTNMVAEPDIERILGAHRDLDETCRRLVDAAKRNGGVDNITAVVARYGDYVAPPARTAATAPIDEEDEEDYKRPTPVPRRPGAARRSGPSSAAFWALAALALVLAVALFVVGGETYEFVGGWPFLQHRPAPKPAPASIPPAAPPNYAQLTYTGPVLVMKKELDGAPLQCDAAGNLFAVVKQTGVPVRIAPDGTATTLVSPDAAPKKSHADRYWATDGQGNLYVSSTADKRITKYDPTGARLGAIGQGQLKAPESVAVNAKGDVFVVDGGSLKVFRAASGPSTSPSQRPSEPTTQRPSGPTTRGSDHAPR